MGELKEKKKSDKSMKSRIWDFCTTVFYGLISILGLGFIVFHIYRAWGIAGLIVVPCLIALGCFLLSRSIKKEERRKEKYREKYISQVVLEDKVFGSLLFERDSAEDTLTCSEKKIPFGNYFPVLELDGPASEQETFFRNLEYLCGRHEEITESLWEVLLEDLSVSREEALKKYYISKIHMQKYNEYLAGEDPLDGMPEDWIISVETASDMEGYKSYTFLPAAYLNCRTREITYVLVE